MVTLWRKNVKIETLVISVDEKYNCLFEANRRLWYETIVLKFFVGLQVSPLCCSSVKGKSSFVLKRWKSFGINFGSDRLVSLFLFIMFVDSPIFKFCIPFKYIINTYKIFILWLGSQIFQINEEFQNKVWAYFYHGKQRSSYKQSENTSIDIIKIWNFITLKKINHDFYITFVNKFIL